MLSKKYLLLSATLLLITFLGLTREIPLVGDLRRDYKFTIKRSRKIELKQVVFFEDCFLHVKIFGQEGLYSYQVEDLMKISPHRNILKDKEFNRWSITFGKVIKFNPHAYIYFDNRRDRYKYFQNLRSQSKVCKRRDLRENILENRQNHGSDKIKTQDNTFKSRQNEENYVATLTDGEQSYIERYRLARKAKRSIYIQTVYFLADESGRKMADLLIKRRSEDGLDIRMILDGKSTLHGPNSTYISNNFLLLHNLMAAGIRVYGFTCANSKKLRLMPIKSFIKQFKTEKGGLKHPFLINNFEHIKILSVDSKRAIVGGMNWGNEYARVGSPGLNRWRDQDVEVKGPIVSDVQKSFLRNFETEEIRFKGYKDDYSCFNPFHPLKDRDKYLNFLNTHTVGYRPQKKLEDQKEEELAWDHVSKLYDGLDFSKQDKPFYPDFKKVSSIRWVVNHPLRYERHIRDAYLQMMDQAKSEIVISNAFMAPTESFKRAWIDAGIRGVQVKMLTNSPETNNLPLNVIIGRYHLKDLKDSVLKAKEEGEEKALVIQYYEWDGKDKNAKDRPPTQGTMHAKFAVFDKRKVLVGSHNIGRRSEEINNESVLIFENEELAKELIDKVNYDIKNHTGGQVSYEQIDYYHKPKGKGYFEDLKYQMKILESKLIEKQL